MSDDEAALLNAIEADRDADLPRLVYADWLDDHGRELRAEFIRIQCEIARLEVGPRAVIDRNVHLWRRQQELLDGYPEALDAGRLGNIIPINAQKWYRGFLDEVVLKYSDARYSAHLLAMARPKLSEIAIEHVEAGAFTHGNFDEVVQSVATSMSFVADFDGCIDYQPIMPPISREWSALRHFSLQDKFSESFYVVQIAQQFMPNLQALRYVNSHVTDRVVIDLLNAGVLQRLTHISLIENAIGDQAAVELADRLGDSPHLKELDLRRNGITIDGQRALLARLGSKVILF